MTLSLLSGQRAEGPLRDTLDSEAPKRQDCSPPRPGHSASASPLVLRSQNPLHSLFGFHVHFTATGPVSRLLPKGI